MAGHKSDISSVLDNRQEGFVSPLSFATSPRELWTQIRGKSGASPERGVGDIVTTMVSCSLPLLDPTILVADSLDISEAPTARS
jgi:hypothetical protein